MINKKNKNIQNKPLILIILDGWGIAAANKGNAITLAKTPVLKKLAKEYPYTEICAHGRNVGLPDGQDGNSEAGHMNLGAGRIVEQDVIRISRSINNGTFFKNAAFLQAIKHIKANQSRLHIMGLLSNGMSAHSDPDHLLALLTLMRGHDVKETYLHLFTDGRDSPQHAALQLVEELQKKLRPNEKIATVMGRYYGMDRKKNWSNTEQAYDVFTCKECTWHKSDSAIAAITESYNRGNTDEFMEPYVIFEKNRQLPRINNKDAVIFFNLRSDRARQIAKTFVQQDFEKLNKHSFKRKNILRDLCFVAMTDFGPDLDSILTAYPSIDITETLPMQLADKRQFYMAETEKYAHVTYFFNGGYADPVAGEQRVLIASPDVKSYDQTPAMSSKELTEMLLWHIKEESFDFITINYACPDMVGHTGNLPAGIKAVESVDKYMGEVVAALKKYDGRAIITADHGNIEEMINLRTGEIDTEHSVNPVPFILFGNDYKGKRNFLHAGGKLSDVAPTILQLLGKTQPKEMNGKSLLKS